MKKVSEKRKIIGAIMNHVHTIIKKGCRAEHVLRLCGVTDETLFCKKIIKRSLCKNCVDGMGVEDYIMENVELDYYNEHVRCKYIDRDIHINQRCRNPEYKDGKCTKHFCESCNSTFFIFKQSFYCFLWSPLGQKLPKDLKILLFNLTKPERRRHHWAYWPREYSYYFGNACYDTKTCDIKIPDVCRIYMSKYSTDNACTKCKDIIDSLNMKKVDNFINENLPGLITGNSYVDFVLQNIFDHPEKITVDSLNNIETAYEFNRNQMYFGIRDYIIIIARLILEILEEKFKKEHPDIFVSRVYNFLVKFLREKLNVTYTDFEKVHIYTQCTYK